MGGVKVFVLLTAIAAAFAFASCSNDSGSDDGGEFRITEFKLVKEDSLKAIGIDFENIDSMNLPYVSAFASLAEEDSKHCATNVRYWFAGKLTMVDSSANVVKVGEKNEHTSGNFVEWNVGGAWKNMGVSEYLILVHGFRKGGGSKVKAGTECYFIDDRGNKSNSVSYSYVVSGD